MVFFPFFFIDAGHALCGVILEVDDVVMAANAAAIAASLRGSKRAVVRWMIAVEEGEKE